VRDNLTLFDETISDEQLLKVLDELGLGDWLQALPHGLDTSLVSGGNLSAGQAQLLALARVFLQDPGLVILDEASARLDPATERLIERAITRLLRGRTALIIAHRLATLERADELLILHEGQMVEHGERTRLLNNPASRFAGLLQRNWQEVTL
jgi:ATP-binding cassette subfamily B protein